MLGDTNITGLIDELYNTLSSAISYGDNKSEHPELLAELLEATYNFSGFKTYHQMNEVGFILESKESDILTFDQFKQQTAKIDSKYNETYLQTEYQFFSESARMANKWADIEADGDRYDLQYRTAGDDKVREEHRALEGTTLPQNDPFWDRYFPPNGYNCRCTVEQVRKGKYPRSDSNAAMALGDTMTEGKKSIFRFNPGKVKSPYPKNHPYMPTGCGDCNNIQLAFGAGKPSCKACRILNELKKKKSREDIRSHFKKDFKGKEQVWSINNGPIKELNVSYQDIKNITGKPHKYGATRNYAVYNLQKIASNSKYIGISPDIKSGASGHATVKNWHYLEFELAGEKSYLVIKEFEDGTMSPHSIQDTEHFREDKIENRAK